MFSVPRGSRGVSTLGDTTKPKRVLLAEDNELLRKLLMELLVSEGFDVVAVDDGLDAFAAFVNEGPFDAVVSDCDLPGMTGAELVARLRDQASGVPALLMSGRVTLEKTDQERLRVGEILRKPFGLDAFVQAIYRLIWV
jgi:DNA-binding response OmpR family regulator